jgi:hypothetical protein
MEAAGSFETVFTRLHGVTSHETVNLRSLKETCVEIPSGGNEIQRRYRFANRRCRVYRRRPVVAQQMLLHLEYY